MNVLAARNEKAPTGHGPGARGRSEGSSGPTVNAAAVKRNDAGDDTEHLGWRGDESFLLVRARKHQD